MGDRLCVRRTYAAGQQVIRHPLYCSEVKQREQRPAQHMIRPQWTLLPFALSGKISNRVLHDRRSAIFCMKKGDISFFIPLALFFYSCPRCNIITFSKYDIFQVKYMQNEFVLFQTYSTPKTKKPPICYCVQYTYHSVT